MFDQLTRNAPHCLARAVVVSTTGHATQGVLIDYDRTRCAR
jgi:hypothetical protein